MFNSPQALHRKLAPVSQQPGFTLIELLVTVAIVAILATIAYPVYTDQIAKARRAEVQAELMSLAGFMERIYTETGCYNPGPDMDCSTTGDAAPPAISAADDHFDYYDIGWSVTPDASSFELEAKPTAGKAQEGDGLLRIDHLGRRWWDENNNKDVKDANEDDWIRN